MMNKLIMKEFKRVRAELKRGQSNIAPQSWVYCWSKIDLSKYVDNAKFFSARAPTYDIEDADEKEGYLIYFDTVDDLITTSLQKRSKKGSSIDILDLGCGTGIRIRRLVNRLDFAYKVRLYACDPSKEMVKIAKKRLGPNTKIANACKLPYKNNSFDAVFMLYTVLGCMNKSQICLALGEVHRVLRPKGVLYLDGLVVGNTGKYFPKRKKCEKHLYYARTDLPGVLGFHYFIEKNKLLKIAKNKGFGVAKMKKIKFHDSDAIYCELTRGS